MLLEIVTITLADESGVSDMNHATIQLAATSKLPTLDLWGSDGESGELMPDAKKGRLVRRKKGSNVKHNMQLLFNSLAGYNRINYWMGIF